MEIHTQTKKSRRDPSTDRRFVRLRPPATLPADMPMVPEWFPGARRHGSKWQARVSDSAVSTTYIHLGLYATEFEARRWAYYFYSRHKRPPHLLPKHVGKLVSGMFAIRINPKKLALRIGAVMAERLYIGLKSLHARRFHTPEDAFYAAYQHMERLIGVYVLSIYGDKYHADLYTRIKEERKPNPARMLRRAERRTRPFHTEESGEGDAAATNKERSSGCSPTEEINLFSFVEL